MEFGLFHEFHRLPQWSEAEAFARSFEQVDAAERWGIDVLWLSELHFMPDYSVLSSPLLVGSAIAARTRRIKIGTGVHVLPLCHPLRVAEEVATLDQISQGRLIFGVGRSNFPNVYDAYGIPYSESQARLGEILEIIKLAWTREDFSYEGTHYHFSRAGAFSVVPKPFQTPHPPIRIAVASAESYAAAGRAGYAIFIALRFQSIAELAALIRTYRQAYRDAGHAGEGGVYVRVPLYVAETRQQAHDEPEESIMRLIRMIGGHLSESVGHSGVRGDGDRAIIGKQLQTITYEEVLREKAIVGTPDVVRDRLVALRDALTLDGIVVELNSGSLIPHERVMKALQLLCEDVIPCFR